MSSRVRIRTKLLPFSDRRERYRIQCRLGQRNHVVAYDTTITRYQNHERALQKYADIVRKEMGMKLSETYERVPNRIKSQLDTFTWEFVLLDE